MGAAGLDLDTDDVALVIEDQVDFATSTTPALVQKLGALPRIVSRDLLFRRMAAQIGDTSPAAFSSAERVAGAGCAIARHGGVAFPRLGRGLIIVRRGCLRIHLKRTLVDSAFLQPCRLRHMRGGILDGHLHQCRR